VKTAGVVDVNCQRCNPEDIVIEAEDVRVRPASKAAIFWQAISANTGPREYDIAVGRPNPNRLYDLDKVNAVSLREQTPFIKKRQDRGPIGVLDNLGGL